MDSIGGFHHVLLPCNTLFNVNLSCIYYFLHFRLMVGSNSICNILSKNFSKLLWLSTFNDKVLPWFLTQKCYCRLILEVNDRLILLHTRDLVATNLWLVPQYLGCYRHHVQFENCCIPIYLWIGNILSHCLHAQFYLFRKSVGWQWLKNSNVSI